MKGSPEEEKRKEPRRPILPPLDMNKLRNNEAMNNKNMIEEPPASDPNFMLYRKRENKNENIHQITPRAEIYLEPDPEDPPDRLPDRELDMRQEDLVTYENPLPPTNKSKLKEYERQMELTTQLMKYPNLAQLLEQSFTGGNMGERENQLELFAIIKDNNLLSQNEYLEEGQNLDNSNSVLDLGAKGDIVSNMSGNAADKVFLIPKSTDTTLVVPYCDCIPKFDVKNKYKSSNLYIYNCPEVEFNKTLELAGNIMKPLRGRVAISELITILLFTAGLAIMLAVFIPLGGLVSYWLTIVALLLYFIFLGSLLIYFKRSNARLLINAHFCLALICRIENNRFYLDKRIRLRPGYLAKWIEFWMPVQGQTTQDLHHPPGV